MESITVFAENGFEANGKKLLGNSNETSNILLCVPFIEDKYIIKNNLEDIHNFEFVLYPFRFIYPYQFHYEKILSRLFENEHILNKLRDNKNNFYLFIYMPTEGFSFDKLNKIVIDGLNKLVYDKGIPGNKILICWGDYNIQKTVIEVYYNDPDFVIPVHNFFSYDHFEYVSRQASLNYDAKYKVVNKQLKNYGVLKTGNLRSQRAYFLAILNHKRLLDKFFYSVIDPGKLGETLNKPSTFLAVSEFLTNKNHKYIKEDLFNSYIEVYKNTPIVLDTNNFDDSYLNKPIFDSNIMNQSAFELVIESEVDINNRGILYLTEKTYNTFTYKFPFLLVSSYGAYRHLHKKGYVTFPELFDESFDTIEECDVRMEYILKSMEKFLNTPLSRIEQIINSDYFKNKLLHNYNNLMLSKDDESSFIKFLNNIKKN